MSESKSALEAFVELVGEEFARLEKKHAAEIAELRVQLRAQCEARAQIKDEVLVEVRSFISKALNLRDEIRNSYGRLETRLDQSVEKLDSIESRVTSALGRIN